MVALISSYFFIMLCQPLLMQALLSFFGVVNYPRLFCSSFTQFSAFSLPKVKRDMPLSSVTYFYRKFALRNGLNSNAWSDWVVENLTSTLPSLLDKESSSRTAGESDTIPHGGLYISSINSMISGNYSSQILHILPASSSRSSGDDFNEEELLYYNDTKLKVRRIYLHSRPNGWGTGVHPTTRLCLEWLLQVFAQEHPIENGGKTRNSLSLLDYGCGSGILSLASLRLGVHKVICVDIEAEALVTADANFKLNGYHNGIHDRDYYQLFHTRQVEPYCFSSSSSSCDGGVDICVANILIGQLVRPSMISALMTNIRPGGLICFSGIRPSEVEALKGAYEPYLEWLDQQYYAELDAQQTEGSIESYGFDVGRWARVVGKVKAERIDVRDMSEMAVM